MIIGTAVRNSLRTVVTALLAAALCLMLTGCGGGMNMGNMFGGKKPSTEATLEPDQAPQPDVPVKPGATLKVALLLPLTAQGPTAAIGKALKNAAELALIDAGSSGITLVTKDTRASASGAQAAANAALNEGASLIIGPLLAQEVESVGPVARTRNVPVIAFSSASSVAGNGVYLMSFLPEEEVDNLVRHAADNGIRKVAAMIPQSAYGSVTETALNQSLARSGGTLVAIDRFPRTAQGVQSAAQAMAGRILNPTNAIQALFLPEGGGMLNAATNSLSAGGVSAASVRMLGTGLWDDAATRSSQLITGGWYAGVAPELVQRFEQRYNQTYGSKPNRLASLAYDAVSLAVIAGRQSGGREISHGAITNPEGYKGVNGLFRFRKNGRIQRGLSILEVTPSGPRVIAPAPARFSAGL